MKHVSAGGPVSYEHVACMAAVGVGGYFAVAAILPLLGFTSSGTYREYIFGVFCNMFRYYVIISFFLTIKYYLILNYLINS